MICPRCLGKGGYLIGPRDADIRECLDCKGSGFAPLQLDRRGLRVVPSPFARNGEPVLFVSPGDYAKLKEKGTMRTTVNIPTSDVLNLNAADLQAKFDQEHQKLVDQFGPGVVATSHNSDGSWTLTFDYADKFEGSAPGNSHLTGFLTPEEKDAVYVARTRLANSGSIKEVDGEYAPIEDGDDIAAQIANSVNVIDRLLDRAK